MKKRPPKLPKKASSSYRLVRFNAVSRRALGTLHGDCDLGRARIRISKEDSRAEQANTVIHEYFHNELWETGIRHEMLKSKTEEMVVRNLANATARLFSGRANPEMRRFLIAALRSA